MSADGTARASVARSLWRCTTMSTMPCSFRYSRALEAVRQFLADGLLDDARAGKADQRAGLGNMHVAQHRIGRGDAAGGRIGQHDDVGLRLRAVPAPRPSCAASASATGCLPACAPPEAANRMKRRLPSTAGSRPVMIASPAAMPSEPPMKSKSCTPMTTVRPSRLPMPSFTASCKPVLVRASLRRSA